MTPDEKKFVKYAREIKKYCEFQYPACEKCAFKGDYNLCRLHSYSDNLEYPTEYPKDWELPTDWTKAEKGFAKYLMQTYDQNCIVKLSQPKGAFELITAMGKSLWSFPIAMLPSLEKNGGEALLSDIAKEDA